jgi:uncharacterized protein (UPF0335 family)
MGITRHRCDKCDASAFATDMPLPEGWTHHRSPRTGAELTVCQSCDEADNTNRSDDDASATDDQLRLFVERIERIEEEIKGANDDRRDVYAELKSQGYDPKIVKLIVKDRSMSPHDRKERDAILETYRCALGEA